MVLQLSLFGNVEPSVAPSAVDVAAIGEIIDTVDPNIEPEDKPRLSRQCTRILGRLQSGPATNIELNEICFRYSARLHDLKKAGFVYGKEKVEKGVWRYWLV